MKSYILVHHATGKDIEVQAEEGETLGEFYLFKREGKTCGMFSMAEFSFYTRPSKESKNTVFKISGSDLVGVLERQKNNDQVLKSDDGNTTVNLTDGTIKVIPSTTPEQRAIHPSSL